MKTHKEILDEVITEAKIAASGDSRTLRAINRAEVEITENGHIRLGQDHAVIASTSSNQIYHAGDDNCESIEAMREAVPCPAFERGHICYHRQIFRLLTAFEARLRQETKKKHATTVAATGAQMDAAILSQGGDGRIQTKRVGGIAI